MSYYTNTTPIHQRHPSWWVLGRFSKKLVVKISTDQEETVGVASVAVAV
jgi:hypothetical protein